MQKKTLNEAISEYSSFGVIDMLVKRNWNNYNRNNIGPWFCTFVKIIRNIDSYIKKQFRINYYQKFDDNYWLLWHNFQSGLIPTWNLPCSWTSHEKTICLLFALVWRSAQCILGILPSQLGHISQMSSWACEILSLRVHGRKILVRIWGWRISGGATMVGAERNILNI